MGKVASFIRAIGIVYLLGMLFFGWGWLSVKFEIFPYQVLNPYFVEIRDFFSESHKESVVDIIAYDHQESKTAFSYAGYQVRDPSFQDNGYLLVSRYDKREGQTLVELFSLAEGKVVFQWVPNLDEIFKLSPSYGTGENTRIAYRSQHPLLMENGDIILSSGEGPLVRIDSCGHPKWAISRHFHHTIERDRQGNLLVPVSVTGVPNEFGVPMRDDGVAVVSPDGEILREFSVYRRLMESGYQGLVYGVGEFETDRLHLNDAEMLPGSDTELMLSIRNLSSIAVLDLESGQFRWLKTGPWVNQHDISYVGDGWFSVFGNNFSRGAWKFVDPGRSEIYLYHPQTDRIETPFARVLQELDMHTEYEGRVKILDNGDAFIEETNRHRLMRISADKVRWEYVNGISETTTGALHWSRYLGSQEMTPAILRNLSCKE